MTTSANVKPIESSHWYYANGQPCYQLPNKSKPGETRNPTLADARKLNLVPSVTTILRILHKQSLVDWLIEQACLAVLTTPKPAEEPIDAFVERVLKIERVQDQESQAAKDRGTEIHGALEAYFTGQPVPEELRPWMQGAASAIAGRGEMVATEKIIVGYGYAGKADLILAAPDCFWIWDWKTTKKLPDPKKGAWSEHRLQGAAYAAAFRQALNKEAMIRTGNVYISTVDCGQFVICEHGDWMETFERGFAPLLTHWQWANDYKPEL